MYNPNKETLEYLSKRGCVELEYGVESINEEVLKLTEKNKTRKK
ncbi:MAG: hypothetical protein QW273_00935 [Candidatus Pacearchaeota archaeon]